MVEKYTIKTNIVEIMCQKNQWIVSKLGHVTTEAKKSILARFNKKSVVSEAAIALNLTFGLTEDIDKNKTRSKKNADPAMQAGTILIEIELNIMIFSRSAVGWTKLIKKFTE